VLYTISNLIIADAFPPSKQSLAGRVFNTMSQIGNSVGLTVGAVIAASVTANQVTGGNTNSGNETSLEKGFQAAFWACTASIAIVVVVSLVGLKKAGKVGLKSE
jgi:MFS family permease